MISAMTAKPNDFETRYALVDLNGTCMMVCKPWRDSLAAVLSGATATYPFKRAGGRGAVRVFEFDDGRGIIRIFRRGGIARWILTDAFLFGNRPLQELRIHDHLFQQGFPCPEPLGASWRRDGLLLRGAIATRLVDGQDLFDCLVPNKSDPEPTLREAGRVIRRMHDLNVAHPDLHIRNILVAGDAVYLIDFDKASLGAAVSPRIRASNLLRLRRSFEKHGLPESWFHAVVDGYQSKGFPRWLELMYRYKGIVSDTFAGRYRQQDHAARKP